MALFSAAIKRDFISLLRFQPSLLKVLEYTDCIFATRKVFPTSILDKQSDGGAQLMLELSEMQSFPSLPSLPFPLWPGVVARDRARSMDQIELFEKLLNWIVRNLTLYIYKICLKILYFIYV